MEKAFGWLAALGLALAAAGGARAATLPPMLAHPLREQALPAVAAPPPDSFPALAAEGSPLLGQAPEPSTLMLLATGLGGLVVLGHRELA